MYQMLLKTILGIILLNVSLLCHAASDSTATEVVRYHAFDLPNTQIRPLHSVITNTNYVLYINLPASYYSGRKKTYPVLYLLDADYSFPLAKQQSEHLVDRHRMRDIIVVGIAYDGPLHYRLHRTRDYTISHVPDGGYGPEFQKVSGGAARFLNFIDKELVPYIDTHFPTSGSRGLIGHSFGGLFAAYSFLEKPELFDKLLIVSPSLWYDHEKLIARVTHLKQFNQKRPHSVYFVIGSKENGGHYRMIDEQKQFVAQIKAKPHKNLAIDSTVMENFDHDTIFPAALSQGLLKLYGKA